MKFKTLFEGDVSTFQDHMMSAAKASDIIQKHGLKSDSRSESNGHKTYQWSGEGDHKTAASLVKTLSSVLPIYHKEKNTTWLRAARSGEINPVTHEVVVKHDTKAGTVQVTHQMPTRERVSVTSRRYQHGDATVEGYNEGSMHYRRATGPTEKSVRAAHAHYVSAFGLTGHDATPPHIKAPVFAGQDFIATWNHFRSDT